MSRISIEKTQTGRSIHLVGKTDGGVEQIIETWFVPDGDFLQPKLCPTTIAVALVNELVLLKTPPWEGLDTVLKTQVRNAVKWIAEEVIK